MIHYSLDLLELLKKRKNKKIVFTNGCFDILHRGHLDYLNRAKELGDYLIVGLNSDAAVRQLKGNMRPVNSEQDRAYFLNNLKAVDCVQIFDELDPLNLIKYILPDFLVKGGDWPVSSIVGAKEVLDAGGQVLSLPFIDGHSTTSFIAKLQGLK